MVHCYWEWVFILDKERFFMKLNDRVSNEDVMKYFPMVRSCINNILIKNWNQPKKQKDVILGNTGSTIEDFEQILLLEVALSLYNFNNDFITKEGQTVKESTYVFRCLYNKSCILIDKYIKRKKRGYGAHIVSLDSLMTSLNSEERE